MEIRIGNKILRQSGPIYFIADIAANHDGNISRAYKLIEMAKEAGADAAKFQNFQAAKIVSKSGFETMQKQLSHQKSWGKPVYDVYQEASIPFDWTEKLKEKCNEVEIDYFTSPYDFESIDAVDPYLEIYKIGSGDITWPAILEYIAKKGKPIILSTGASDMADVERAMKILQKHTKEIVLMQCNTNYTASLENFNYINLNVLKTFKRQFPEVLLGLSDHTRGCATVLGAVSLGATVFEKHFTDDNDRKGPDHKFATNPEEWSEMVTRANELIRALGDGIKRIEKNEQESVIVQRRSLRFVIALPAGHVIKSEDFFPLRPIPKDGISPYEIDKLIGKKLVKAINADDYIKWEDVV